ncbi:MAG: NYN domain-containing protein [Candidatus Rokuibacteriota bacterium]
MPPEPPEKRAVVFVDGQNLFHAAREAFGYTYPNYDVAALAARLCRPSGWTLIQTRFYTGIPERLDNAFWHDFWAAKLAVMGRQGIHVFSRSLRYRNRTVRLPDGTTHAFMTGEEKGIDVRLALDVIRMAHRRELDVALILSQDQDLSELAAEIRAIAREQDRWTKVASAFPLSPTSRNRRGIDRTDWLRIDRALYDACLDRRDYRAAGPAKPGGPP